MTRRFSLLAATLLLLLAAGDLWSQANPVIGADFEVVYHPDPAGPLASSPDLTLVYAFNFWGTRGGTRLALLENLLRPDTTRVKRVPLTRTELGWKAVIAIPLYASVLSYYVTDGTTRDDNQECTYTRIVEGTDGKAVRNAHFFTLGFLELARAPIAQRVAEAEAEVRTYPDNFKAYFRLFALMFEQEKGDERVQQKIVERLAGLEQRYPNSEEVYNLEARTYYYLLRNVEKGLEYKKKIGIPNQWPEVVLMFDRDQRQEEQRRLTKEKEQRRASMVNAPLPDVTFLELDGNRHRVRGDSGSVIALVFWATSSERSRSLLPSLQRLHERHGGRGLKVIAVSLDADTMAVRKFAAEQKLGFLPLMNMGGYAVDLGVDSIPQTYIVDRQLVVRRVIVGFNPETAAELEQVIGSLL
jgi:hypothetical protein